VVDTSTRPAHSSRTENRTNELRHIRIGKGSKKGDTGTSEQLSQKRGRSLSLTPMWFPSLCSLKPVRSRTLPATSRHTDTEREGDAEHERHARERKKSNETARHSHKPVYRHKTPSYASAFLRFACRLIEKEKSFLTGFRRNFCIWGIADNQVARHPDVREFVIHLSQPFSRRSDTYGR